MDKLDFWIDCGGTFTDIVAVAQNGQFKVHKILSHSPHYKSAVVQGISEILGHTRFQSAVNSVRLGTTVATNAFLEKNGIACALVTTLGQRDVLEIRQQNRPELFALDIKKVAPLYSYVTHIEGRMNAEGEILKELDLEIAEFELRRILAKGINSVAISLLHSTVNPIHEILLGELAENLGFEYVSLSHQVSPLAKYIARTETAVVDAYLSPYLKQYTNELAQDLGIDNILYMQSDGNLCLSRELKGYNALLSGPAGGLVGAIEAAKQAGENKIITFDMGGTSTDVALYAGELNIDLEPQFHGIKILAPMANIYTVAAGGGSILRYDGGRFLVGPESARAYPGPACYRNGGPLTITDANLFLGHLEPEKFPSVFGPNRNLPLDRDIVAEKFNQLAAEIGMSPREVAEGFLAVAVEKMGRAIKKVSLDKGFDPKDFTLVSFGGAGGQLACRVAENLEMKKVFIHPMSSVLSAFGMGLAEHAITLRGRYQNGFNELEAKYKGAHQEVKNRVHYYILYAEGSDHEVEIQANDLAEAKEKFQKYYKLTFGMILQNEILCENIALKLIFTTPSHKLNWPLQTSKKMLGFNIISENNTSIVLEKNWQALLSEQGTWSLVSLKKQLESSNQNKAIELELFYQRFQFIAEQMGYTLQKLAQSVNIKERNDFSCALFSSQGELLANAPHIPVHLGSMGDAVKAVMQFKKISAGQSYICNDPSFGGTHLPDITIITPVFCADELVMWVASRGHHADVGGVSPGSMPGSSHHLSEEGVIIPPTKIVEDGELAQNMLEKILTKNQFPVRNFAVNLHDIQAKIAANNQGVHALEELFNQHGVEKVLNMVEAILDYSDKKMRSIFDLIPERVIEKTINSERQIKLAIKKSDTIEINFTGSSPTLNSNFNAPMPVVKASVLFVLRTLIDEGIPLNDGILRSINLVVPKDTMLNPKPGAPVVAGNVETSQVICDVLYCALGIKANSQGTMNNLSFGNGQYQYYETIAGGSGASASADGASAVQVNMTNSLLTDPEVFEKRYPVLIELMGIRHGSGGAGLFHGGAGIYRKLKFNLTMQVSMISQNRLAPPQGIAGGEDALVGNQFLEKNGKIIKLPECFTTEVLANERLLIETPGGGGYGRSQKSYTNLVFGFGSNMDLAQIKQRCPSTQLVCRAIIKNKEIRYTRYCPSRGGGVADMYEAAGHQVWGLLVDMDDRDLVHLDQIECGDLGYQRIPIEVEDDNGKVWNAWAYDVIDKKPDIKPTKIYEWLVYSGAYNLNVPEYYLDHIKSFRESV